MLMTASPEKVAELFETSVERGEARTRFEGLNVKNKTFTGTTLSCSDWLDCDLENCLFMECDLRGASLRYSQLRGSIFARCAVFGCELPNDPTIRLVDCVGSV